MSPRAACRLTQLGFAPVYDYTLGKVDWIAAGLPTDRAGQPGRRVLDAVRRDVPACAPGAPAGPALQQARSQGWDRCVVIAGQRTVVGLLRADRISAGEQAPAAEVMQPGPTTVRAHEDLDATRQRMNEHHVAHLLVTTPDGTPDHPRAGDQRTERHQPGSRRDRPRIAGHRHTLTSDR